MVLMPVKIGLFLHIELHVDYLTSQMERRYITGRQRVWFSHGIGVLMDGQLSIDVTRNHRGVGGSIGVNIRLVRGDWCGGRTDRLRDDKTNGTDVGLIQQLTQLS